MRKAILSVAAAIITFCGYSQNGSQPQHTTSPAAVASIKGQVVLPSGLSSPTVSGYVLLYSNGGGASNIMVPVDSVHITKINDSVYAYSFDTVAAGKYLIVSYTDTAFTIIPKYAKTYFKFNSGTDKWEESDTLVIPFGSTTSRQADIKVITPITFTKGGVMIKGSLKEGTSFGKMSAAGDPIKGIDISLDKIPDGVMRVTSTDANGEYQFDNLPSGDYSIYADIPGLPMPVRYYMVVTDKGQTEKIPDFVADSVHITVDYSTSIRSFQKAESMVKVYPNPVTPDSRLIAESNDGKPLSVTIYNNIGQTVYSNPAMSNQGVKLAELNLSKGVYMYVVRNNANLLDTGSIVVQ